MDISIKKLTNNTKNSVLLNFLYIDIVDISPIYPGYIHIYPVYIGDISTITIYPKIYPNLYIFFVDISIKDISIGYIFIWIYLDISMDASEKVSKDISFLGYIHNWYIFFWIYPILIYPRYIHDISKLSIGYIFFQKLYPY